MICKQVFVLGLCFSTIAGYAQNLGFVNKKTAIGGGVLFEGPSEFWKKPVFTIQMEQAVLYKKSLELSYSHTFVESNLDNYNFMLDDLRTLDKFNHKDHKDYNRIEVNPELKGLVLAEVSTFNLALKTYLKRRGAIAPFGKFVSFGVKANFITLTKLDAFLNGTLTKNNGSGLTNYPLILHLAMDERLIKSSNVGLHFGFGEKRFINKSQFFEYSAGIQLKGIYLNRYYYIYSQNQAAHLSITKDQRSMSIFYLKGIYGFAL